MAVTWKKIVFDGTAPAFASGTAIGNLTLTDNNIKWLTGDLYLQTDEGTNTNSSVMVKGKGTGYGLLRIYDQDDAEYLSFLASNGIGYITTAGTSPQSLKIQSYVAQNVIFWDGITSGNPYLYMYGWDGGTSSVKWLRHQVNSGGDSIIQAEESLSLSAFGGGASGSLYLQANANCNVSCFSGAIDGENPSFIIYGYDHGAGGLRTGTLQVGDDGTFNITASDGAISFGDENLSTTGMIGIGTSPTYPLHIVYTNPDTEANMAATYSAVTLSDSSQSYGHFAHGFTAIREATVDTFAAVAPWHNLQLHTEDRGAGLGSVTSGIIGIFNYVKCNNDGGVNSHPDLWAHHNIVNYGSEGWVGTADCVPYTITVEGNDVNIYKPMVYVGGISGLTLSKLDVGNTSNSAANRGEAVYVPCKKNLTLSVFVDQGGNIWKAPCNAEPSSVTMDGTSGVIDATPDAEFDYYWDAGYLYIYAATDPDARYTSGGVIAVGSNGAWDNVIKGHGDGDAVQAIMWSDLAGATDIQYKVGDPTNQWHMGMNIGSVGAGVWSLYQGDASAHRIKVSTTGQIFFPGVYDDDIGTERDLLIQSDGQIGYDSSARRFKTRIKNMEDTSWLYDIRPVNFEFKKKPGEKCYGAIAEEVAKVCPELVFYGTDGKADGIYKKNLIFPLINELQKLQVRVAKLESA